MKSFECPGCSPCGRCVPHPTDLAMATVTEFLSMKSYSFLYCELQYENGQDFLDVQNYVSGQDYRISTVTIIEYDVDHIVDIFKAY